VVSRVSGPASAKKVASGRRGGGYFPWGKEIRRKGTRGKNIRPSTLRKNTVRMGNAARKSLSSEEKRMSKEI